jgi:hypothetical protein
MFLPADAIVDVEDRLPAQADLVRAGDQPAAWWELGDVGTEPGDPGEFRLQVPPASGSEETGNPFTTPPRSCLA